MEGDALYEVPACTEDRYRNGTTKRISCWYVTRHSSEAAIRNSEKGVKRERENKRGKQWHRSKSLTQPWGIYTLRGWVFEAKMREVRCI
jgi:hypothetical protein